MLPATNSNTKHSSSLINAQFITIYLILSSGFLIKKAQYKYYIILPKSQNISTILKPYLASYTSCKKYLEDNSNNLAFIVKK
jgi:hypothetical protein